MSAAWQLRVTIGAVIATAAIGLASVSAQQPPAAAAPPGQTANMTGKGGFVDSKDLNARRIKFEAGARTYWHTHTNDQVIVAEEGEGRYQVQGQPVKAFVPGQAVLLPANMPHWHGAAPGKSVVQATMYAGTLKWAGPVSDEEYSGKKSK